MENSGWYIDENGNIDNIYITDNTMTITQLYNYEKKRSIQSN
jgi:hypothetical protein